MPRKKLINPCKMKGMDLGSRGSGRTYKMQDRKTGMRLKHLGCECGAGFVCSKSKDVVERMYYGLNFLDGTTHQIRDPAANNNPLLVSVPCQETFLRKSSLGTKIHKLHNFETSRFKGCHDVEKWLLLECFVQYESREKLLNSGDISELNELSAQIGDYGKLDDETAMLEHSLGGSRSEYSYKDLTNTLIDIAEWRASFNRESTYISRDSGPEPEEIPQEELQIQVDQLLECLTTKQRNALKRVYLENHENESQATIARRLGIREDSLQERITGALRKIRESKLKGKRK